MVLLSVANNPTTTPAYLSRMLWVVDFAGARVSRRQPAP